MSPGPHQPDIGCRRLESTQALATLDTPRTVVFDALNPATAQNISNYSLINNQPSTTIDESQFILTATFVADPATLDPTNTFVVQYNGHINLTFAPGLPAGNYEFVAHTTELQYPGITDAAGNPLDDTQMSARTCRPRDFVINLQRAAPAGLHHEHGAREHLQQGTARRSSAPSSRTSSCRRTVGPTRVTTCPLLPPPSSSTSRTRSRHPQSEPAASWPINYTNDVQLIASANTVNGSSDGDFGNLGEGGLGSTGTGFTILPGVTVVLYNYDRSGRGLPPPPAGRASG